MVMNAGMQQYGNDYYVGTMTVMFSIEQLLRLPADGLCQGAEPIMSYNYGAGKPERVKKTFSSPGLSFGFTTTQPVSCSSQIFISRSSSHGSSNHHPPHD